jgi:Ca2+-binding RTX toxin-like protein
MPAQAPTPGNDSLQGTDGNDTLLGLGGNDTLISLQGNDTVDAGDGDDFINGFGFNPVTGAYSLYPSSGLQTLRGGAGNDFIVGGDDADSADGGPDQDTVFGGGGNDTLDGGTGADLLRGEAGDDHLAGAHGPDTLHGDGGHDSLDGGAEADLLEGGDGHDTLVGGDGDDRLLTGDGDDRAEGGAGDDDINTERGNNPQSPGIYPSSGAQSLEGGAGQDVVAGGSGNDSVDGGDGHDTLWGQEGADTLLGGAGDDLIITDGGPGGDVAADSVDGGEGHDSINGRSTDMATGTYSFWASSGAQTLRGGSGDDFIVGGTDGDLLDGGSGDDTLHGLDGNDTLVGGTGVDRLVGGGGDDTYVVSSPYTVIEDSNGAADHAEIHASFVKIPSTVEQVTYLDGARPLPYWIDALLPDDAAGLYFRTLLGPGLSFGYTFPSTLPTYDTQLGHGDGYAPFTAAQQARALEAFAYIASVTALSFVPVASADTPNTLALARNAQTGSSGYATYPDSRPTGSDVFIDVDLDPAGAWPDGTYAAHVLIHEIGHALGLKHPFSTAEDMDDVAEPPYLQGNEDSTAWTRMSYTVRAEDHSLRLTAFDIAALQYLYGVDAADRPGDDRHVLNGGAPGQFIWDGAGRDTLDASSLAQGATLYLEPGFWGHVGAAPAATISSPGQFTVNFGTVLEDLLGSPHDDRLHGNGVANGIDGGAGQDRLEGQAGDDTLAGGAGADTLVGGAGDDRLEGGAGPDVAVFTGLRADYDVTPEAATGAVVVTDRNPGRDGTDTLRAVETLSFADGDVAAPAAPAGATLQVRAYAWRTHTLLPGVVVEPVPGGGAAPTASAPSGADGRTQLGGLPDGVLAFSARREVPAAEAAATQDAVNLQDAVAILKLVAGQPVNPNGQALSPYQAHAADFDANGTVSLADALGVLRHAVGRPAPEPAWIFFDEASPALPLTPPTAPGAPAALQATLPSGATLGLVGVLRGDVDGSWTPPAGAADLDDIAGTYFQDLVAALNAGPGPDVSLAQWGIYTP